MRRAVLLLLLVPLVAALIAPGATGSSLVTIARAQAPVGGLAPPPAETGYTGGPIVVPLYAHIYDLLQTAPLNTQPMIDLDLARGFGNPSVSGAGPLDGQNSLRWVSSPGLVEYNVTEDGFPRMHPERGISYDVMLDTSQPIIGHFFLGVKALDAPQAGQTTGPEVGLAAALTVRMTLRAGDDIGSDLDAGELIAQGATTLAPDKWPVNGAPVEFVVDMGTPKTDRLPGIEAFNVNVEWFNAESPDGAVHATQRDWVVHTGAKFPNRIEVATMNPLALYALRPTPLGSDQVSLHAVLNSPFGNYDVDVRNATMTVTGPMQPKSMQPALIVQRSFEHNHHYEPVEMTWLWNHRIDRAPAGDYTVTVTAPNLQQTATVTKSATFVIDAEGRATGYDDTGGLVAPQGEAAPAGTPGTGMLGLLVAGAIALAAAGRRGQR